MRALLLAITLSIFTLPASAQDSTATAEEDRGFELLTNGDPNDDAEARRLLETAAAQQRPEAINALSSMLYNGVGGPADAERARTLLLRAAELGSIGANMTLAERYINGDDGLPRDAERGYRHAVAAAESVNNVRGAAWAQWRVGMMTLQGVGTSADPVRAYGWVARASENGSVHAMVSRAVMLAIGQGIARDPQAAREWYLRAAESGELGSAHGLRGLGAMLVTGEGGARDIPRGYAYLVLAQEGGDENAAALLERFQGYFSDPVRQQAQSIILAWRLAHPSPLPDNHTQRLN